MRPAWRRARRESCAEDAYEGPVAPDAHTVHMYLFEHL